MNRRSVGASRAVATSTPSVATHTLSLQRPRANKSVLAVVRCDRELTRQLELLHRHMLLPFPFRPGEGVQRVAATLLPGEALARAIGAQLGPVCAPSARTGGLAAFPCRPTLRLVPTTSRAALSRSASSHDRNRFEATAEIVDILFARTALTMITGGIDLSTATIASTAAFITATRREARVQRDHSRLAAAYTRVTAESWLVKREQSW